MAEKRRGKRMAVVALFRGVGVGMAALLLLTLLTPGSAQSPNLQGAQLSLNPTIPISTFQQPILVNAPLAQKSE
jgi:hypothetical protein